MYTDYTEENEDELYYDDENNNQNDNEKIKKIIIYAAIGVVAFILLLVMVKGCSNNKKKPTETQKPAVTLGVSELTLDVGETYDMQVDVLFAKVNNPSVDWVSESPSIATVDKNGKIKGIAVGTTTILATYTENKVAYTNKCKVNVVQKIIKLGKINLSQKEISIKVGETASIKYTLSPSNAKASKISFESSNTNVAMVDSNGTVIGVSAGTAKITLKNDDGTVTNSLNVTVSKVDNTPKVIDVSAIKILGFSSNISIGKSVEVVYDISPSNATNKTLKWASSNDKVAVVQVTGSKVTVTGKGAGKCTITATSSNNITAKIDVNIVSNVVQPAEIKIVGSDTISMKLKETRFLSYIFVPENTTNDTVTFSSSNKSIVFIDSNGIMAAVGKGTAKVTVTSSSGKSASVTVKVS